MITKGNLHEVKKMLAVEHNVSARDIIIDSIDSFEFDYNGALYLAKLGNDEREGIENFHNSVYFLNLTVADDEIVFDRSLNTFFIDNIADQIPALNPGCMIATDAPYFRYWYSDQAEWEYYFGYMPRGKGPHFLKPEELIKLGKAKLISYEE